MKNRCQEEKAREIARQEIELMRELSRRPRTRLELEYELGISRRRLEYLLHGLREVEYVYRVPGTHLLAMKSCE
jgi:hypothetical protein